MRRSSVITILLLVLVIIGLTVALVVTNLPQCNEETTNDTAVQESSSDNNEQVKEEETPTYIALDSDIAKDMYSMLNGSNVDFFHYFKGKGITEDNFTNEEKQIIGYYYYAINYEEELDAEEGKDGIKWKKIQLKYMDEAIRKVFGNTEYEPTYGYFIKSTRSSNYRNLIEYNSEKNVYYVYQNCLGMPGQYIDTAFCKIEEYKDRYEVTEKMLVEHMKSDLKSSTLCSFYGGGVIYSSIIDDTDNIDIESLTNDKNVRSYSSNNSDRQEKLISKYYDDATEYKHTFMKNSDGTYYWVKSEIVK